MATTDLKLDEPGSLPKPGPVGRMFRLLFGLLCWNGILPGLFLISCVINIGYSRSWGKSQRLSAPLFLPPSR
jgi:hypothetical protein